LSTEVLRQVEELIKEDSNDSYNVYDLENVNELALSIYICPSDEAAVDKFNSDYRAVNYSGVAGSYFSRRQPAGAQACMPILGKDDDCVGPVSSFCKPINTDGMLFPGSTVKQGQISDGASRTMLIGERWYQMRSWTVGNYYGTGLKDPDPMPPVGYTPYQNCSSSSKNIDARYPPNANLNTVGYYVAHDNDVDRPQAPPGAPKTIAFSNVPFGSFHSGGTNFVYADGSVHFITDDVDIEAYLAMASRNGEETISIQ
jgi:prepilin-type processing-associated H-X9-DG protein